MQASDLQSIFAHELGHLLGLDHSCNASSDSARFIGCNKSGIPADYLSAVMFPSVSFDTSGVGQVKRDPASNDQGRANCLYDQYKKN